MSVEGRGDPFSSRSRTIFLRDARVFSRLGNAFPLTLFRFDADSLPSTRASCTASLYVCAPTARKLTEVGPCAGGKLASATKRPYIRNIKMFSNGETLAGTAKLHFVQRLKSLRASTPNKSAALEREKTRFESQTRSAPGKRTEKTAYETQRIKDIFKIKSKINVLRLLCF